MAEWLLGMPPVWLNTRQSRRPVRTQLASVL